MSTESPAARGLPARGLTRLIGLLVGLTLLSGAVYFVSQNADRVGAALSALRDPAPADVALLVAAILGNLVVSAAVFSILMSRHGRVGIGEMQALIAASALLNYLPLRPGLFGRVAYHRLVNQIPVRATAQVVIVSIGLSAAVGLYAAFAIGLSRWTGISISWTVAALPGAAALGLARPAARIASAVVLLKSIDLFIWAARYVLVFRLIDTPIALDTALALAIISMFASMIPFLSNGLGLREWAVGLATPLLEIAVDSPLAIAADLVNRAAELIVITIAGAIGLLVLAPRRRLVREQFRRDYDVGSTPRS